MQSSVVYLVDACQFTIKHDWDIVRKAAGTAECSSLALRPSREASCVDPWVSKVTADLGTGCFSQLRFTKISQRTMRFKMEVFANPGSDAAGRCFGHRQRGHHGEVQLQALERVETVETSKLEGCSRCSSGNR